MTLIKDAEKIGAGYSIIDLPFDNEHRQWQSQKTKKFGRVEHAALDYFIMRGWHGYAREGGLILNLIKAMSFRNISLRHRSVLIEALYAQNVSYMEDLFDPQELINTLRNAGKWQIIRNYMRMTSNKANIEQYGGGQVKIVSSSSRNMLDVFPALKLQQFIGLYNAMGNERLCEVAKIFAKNPYQYRQGWPDLTLWAGEQVIFREIKALGDGLSESQKILIKDILVPLGLDVGVVSVHPSEPLRRSFLDCFR